MTTVSLGMFLVAWLSKNNIVNAYGLPGAAISGLNNAFWDDRMCLSNMSTCNKGILVPEPTKTLISRVKYHSVSSESNMSFMASRNPISYIMTTSGPGITNAINGIAESDKEGFPLLTIHGDSNATYELPYIGFQELDIQILDPVSEYMLVLSDIIPIQTIHENRFNSNQMNILIEGLHNVINILYYGRSKTACIVVPSNYWDIQCDQMYSIHVPVDTIHNDVTISIKDTITLLSKSKRPVLVTGPMNSGINSNSYLVLRDILSVLRIPTVSSFAGRGIVDENSPISLGLGGGLGNNTANYATINSDLIIFLGTDNMGGSLSKFIDIMTDPSSTKLYIGASNKQIESMVTISNGTKVYYYDIDVSTYLKSLYKYIYKHNHSFAYNYQPWFLEIKNITYNTSIPYKDGFTSPNVISFLYPYIRNNKCILDVGNTWYFASQLYKFPNPNDIFITSKFSSIGGSLGYACGVYDSCIDKTYELGIDKKDIYVIIGDGGFYCYYGAMLDLASRMRNNDIHIKIILIDDSLYSAVYTGDMVKYGVSTTHTLTTPFAPPNLKPCIEGLGIKYYLCNDYSELGNAISIHGSIFIHVKCKSSFVLIHPNNDSYRLFLDNNTDKNKVKEFIYA